MSDYWSGIFLLATIIFTLFLFSIVLVMMLLRKKNRRLNIIAFAIVASMLSIWVVDRFVVGFFCLPWECVKRNINIDALLLEEADLIDDWVVRKMLNYAYVPRASSAYVERTFHSDTKFQNKDFFQEIYQYRSVRGASFQYNALRYDLARKYSPRHELVFPQISFRDNNAKAYIIECFYNSGNSCYYIAQYEEYVVVLEMPFLQKSTPLDDLIKIIHLVDEKFSKALRNSSALSP